MKTITAILLFLVSTSVYTQVAVVNVYQPLPGKSPLTMQYMSEARTIHQAAGVQVALTYDLKGIYRYALFFENWESYGQFTMDMRENAAWLAFQTRISSSPSATQIDNLLLNQRAAAAAGGGPGSVTQVTVWLLPPEGNMADLVRGGMGAKPIHEKAGAAVSIYAEGGNTMYYLMRFDDMAAWGKFRDTPNPEFSAYMQSQVDPETGRLGADIIEQYTMVAF